ncbi:MAG: Holliday junction branch migration protein RuvA [Eubacterium sp.]|nr:Holliday junction branch migration protein RuvA [Eubacterium sp.]
MISYVKGIAAYADNENIVIDNHGIGYQIRAVTRTINRAEMGRELMLHTYLYVREDIMALYGFETREELRTFQILLGVNGIGPKAAMSLLSTLTVEELYYAVFSEDAKSIARTPGIGPKGAKRMIMELKDKLHLEDLGLGGDSGPDESGGHALAGTAMDQSDQMMDTLEALVALGYSNGEAYRAVHKVAGARDMKAEQLLKEALKIISSGIE